MITLEFSDNSDRYIGYAEGAVGVGLLIGPALGSLMYGFLGYVETFVAFGVVLMLSMIPLYIFLPDDLN